MLKKISTIISYVFHPILYYFYIFTIILLTVDEVKPLIHFYRIELIIGYIFVNTVIIPIAVIYFLKKDLFLKSQSERTVPFIITALIYLVVYFFLQKFVFPSLLTRYILGISIGLFLLAIFNLRLKISMHTTGAGGLIGFFMSLPFLYQTVDLKYLYGSIIIAGLVGSARMSLQEHDSKEIYLGYLVGFVPVIFFMLTDFEFLTLF